MSLFNRRRAAAATLVASAALLAACGTAGDSTGPARPVPGVAAQTAVSPAQLVQGLAWKVPFASPVVASRMVYNSTASEIDIPAAAFHLHVPMGALPQDSMRITVTIRPGKLVFYELEPHGTVFRQPLTIIQNLAQTNAFRVVSSPAQLVGAYVADTTTIDDGTQQVYINETETTTLSATGGQLNYQVPHFSGYMISVGRQ